MTRVILCPHFEGVNAALNCLTQFWAAPEILRGTTAQVAHKKSPVVPTTPSLQKTDQLWKAWAHHKQAQRLPSICEWWAEAAAPTAPETWKPRHASPFPQGEKPLHAEQCFVVYL